MHIPHRTSDIPEEFKGLLQPGKMNHVLCTGNVCSKAQDEYLRTLSNRFVAPSFSFLHALPYSMLSSVDSSVHIVRGDMDSAKFEYPEQKVIKIGEFSIGLVHGHQVVPWGDPEALANVQRKLDVDILITGHTHKNEVCAILLSSLAPALLLFMVSVRCSLFFSGLRI
jgi:vacuolar protein sorting-associated protein 29